MRVLADLFGLSRLARQAKFMHLALYGLLAGNIHKSVRFGKNVSIAGQGHIAIGEGTFFRDDIAINLAPNSSLKFGKDVQVGYGVRISVPTGRTMIIGDRVRLNSGCVLSGEIQVESDCVLAAHAYIVSDSHNFLDPKLNVDENDRKHGLKEYRVHIGAGAFVGAYTRVFGPARIGARSIVGAGVTTSGDLPDEHLIKVSSKSVSIRPRNPAPL